MTNTFSPDPDREELDLLLRGFQVSGMLSRSLIYGSRTKSQPTATSRCRRLPIHAPFHPEPLGRVLRAVAYFRIFRITADVVSHTPRCSRGSRNTSRLFFTACRRCMPPCLPAPICRAPMP